MITKKEAIELTIELWSWLRDNPGKRKKDWPKWDTGQRVVHSRAPQAEGYYFRYERIPYGCFLCLVFKNGNDCLSKCPLRLKHCKCEEDNHPYTAWWNFDPDVEFLACREAAADAIVLLCEQALEMVDEK